MVGVQTISKSLGGVFACGLQGLLPDIPVGFTHTTLLLYGNGVHECMSDWGNALLRRSGKPRTLPTADVVVSHLGYWTDNGAYYSYLTENATASYESTLEHISAYLHDSDIPAAYVQYDSYWYQKAKAGGMFRWEPNSVYFPHGFNWTLSAVPTVLHANYFDETTDYRNSHNMQCADGFCIPLDDGVYLEMMGKAKEAWHLAVYEQDWMITVFEGMGFMRKNITAARTWLVAMGDAAAHHGLTVQYCMATAGQLLQSTEIPAVTQARARHDYRPSIEAWDIGLTSMLIWSVGIYPFKDDFWSSRNETGCRYPLGCLEPNPLLNALVSALSAGPVGPSDKIGLIDKTLVMRTCRSDGLLLKPDRPFFPPDASFRSTFAALRKERVHGDLGHVKWTIPFNIGTTESQHGALLWRYVLATRVDATGVGIHPLDIDMSAGDVASTEYVAFDFFAFQSNATVAVFSDTLPLLLVPVHQPSMSTQVPFSYQVVAPVITLSGGAIVILGETDKFVTMSTLRFTSFLVGDSAVTLEIVGVAGETVLVSYAAGWSIGHSGRSEPVPSISSVSCLVGQAGGALVKCDAHSCACSA
eukprot:Opistho-2@17610